MAVFWFALICINANYETRFNSFRRLFRCDRSYSHRCEPTGQLRNQNNETCAFKPMTFLLALFTSVETGQLPTLRQCVAYRITIYLQTSQKVLLISAQLRPIDERPLAKTRSAPCCTLQPIGETIKVRRLLWSVLFEDWKNACSKLTSYWWTVSKHCGSALESRVWVTRTRSKLICWQQASQWVRV